MGSLVQWYRPRIGERRLYQSVKVYRETYKKLIEAQKIIGRRGIKWSCLPKGLSYAPVIGIGEIMEQAVAALLVRLRKNERERRKGRK